MKHIDTLSRTWRLILPLLLFFVAGSAVAQTPTPVDSCQYKIVMQSGWGGGWRGGYLAFGMNPHSVGAVGLNQDVLQLSHVIYGTATSYFYLPKGWISVEYHDMNPTWSSNPWGAFSIYDENDSLVFQGPQNLPEYFLWYNSCNYDIPDTVKSFSYSVQDNVVHLGWTNPILSINDDTLNTLSRVEIRRNEELIHTFANVSPGELLTFSENLSNEGTYLYTVQCFNEAGGGIPAIAHITIGSNWVLHNNSNSGQYVDTACMVSISNDGLYTFGGQTTLTVYQSDTTKMLKISGHALPDSNAHIQVYAGTPENGLLLASDTLMILTPYRSATFVFDFAAGSSPEFHYTVECVNSLYEHPDTTIAIAPDSNGIIYVTQEGAGLRNGSSWANATPWLNHALNIADTMTVKPVIWVGHGTYYGTLQQYDNDTYAFIGRNGVNVYGGFAGNEPADYDLASRNFEENETRLDGLLQYNVLLPKSSEWNGFHILNGVIGCMFIKHVSSILRKCSVTNCLVDGIHSNHLNTGSLVDCCVISHNNGNGINAEYELSVKNSQVSYNSGNGLFAFGNIYN